MAFKPAHKDTDTPPGQVVNPIDRSKTIGGIIDRVMREEAKPIKQKLSFEEWWDKNGCWTSEEEFKRLRGVWKAAQENV